MARKLKVPFFLKFHSRYALLKYFLKFSTFLLVSYLAARIIFFLAFQDSPKHDLVIQSTYLGLKFDFRLIGVQAFLNFILLTLPSRIFRKVTLLKAFFLFFNTLLMAFIALVYIVDIGHYSYLQKRVHFSILENFENPLISYQMMMETYPIIPILLVLILYVYIFFRFQRKIFIEYISSINTTSLITRGAERVGIFLVIAFFVYGKVAHFPLRWSEAYFSPDNFISQWTLNPVLNFLETLNFSSDNFDKKEVEKHYPQVAKFLGVEDIDSSKLNFERKGKPVDEVTTRPNIVLIQLESLASNKTSIFNNPLDPTPKLKQIASQSLVYKKFFTPTEATARGVWATLTGIPDIAPRKSSSRNPHLVDQKIIANQFKGYEKFYFLGGSANWGNIRSLFSNNIEKINIYEEGDYKANRVDVWGISDLDLFRESHEKIKDLKKPFFAYIQSAGFHRPYTIPEDNEGFQLKKLSQKQLEDYGFHSDEEYNSLRFQDHAFGHFMKLAKKSKYYENTIFVVFGDHGIPVLKDSLNMAKGYYKHRLVLHHVPLVIHYPKVLAPQEDSRTIGSLVDILPTIASLAGVPWKTQTFGRDLRAERLPQQNYSFIFSWHAPIITGLIGEKFYLQSRGGKSSLYLYEESEPLIDRSKENPIEFQFLSDLTKGLYETIKYIRFKNRK